MIAMSVVVSKCRMLHTALVGVPVVQWMLHTELVGVSVVHLCIQFYMLGSMIH